MMGVYTGRLFRAAWPGFEDFGIPSHLDQPKHVCTRHSIAMKNLFSIQVPPQMVNSVHIDLGLSGCGEPTQLLSDPCSRNPYLTPPFSAGTHLS